MQELKDSEILARLIYRAFIGPAEPGDDNAVTFPMALQLHARVAAREATVAGLKLETPLTLIPAEPQRGSAEPEPAAKSMRGLNGGKATEEKRQIYARLMTFCAVHGLGARRRIAEASDGKLTLTDVQDMTDAKQVDVKLWRIAAQAMDRIEEEET